MVAVKSGSAVSTAAMGPWLACPNKRLGTTAVDNIGFGMTGELTW